MVKKSTKKAAKKAVKAPMKMKKAKKPMAKKASKKKVMLRLPKPKSRTAGKPLAGTSQVIPQPMMDVTAQVKQDVVELPPPPSTPPSAPTSLAPQGSSAPAASAPAALSPEESAQRHEEFTSALTQEPPKKPGFWARLFGKK